ncbi:aspartate-semialdehyde dehydrogenase, partial [Pseudomonas aeruginosa]|nr:aspartate-semialdehyde dehydrogenase [Pseudomonas aeruginosa]
MLPPIPQGLIPVTVQQDPPKPRPATPPVAPTQAGDGGIPLPASFPRRAPGARRRHRCPRQERDEESWLEEE